MSDTACQERYMKTEKGKIARDRAAKKYRSSEKGRENIKKYEQSERGKRVHKKVLLKGRYGMTLTDFDILYNQQKGCCATCGKHQSELKESLSVDHNHITGKIRGLVCRKCNIVFGLVGDNVDILKQMVCYLTKI